MRVLSCECIVMVIIAREKRGASAGGRKRSKATVRQGLEQREGWGEGKWRRGRKKRKKRGGRRGRGHKFLGGERQAGAGRWGGEE